MTLLNNSFSNRHARSEHGAPWPWAFVSELLPPLFPQERLIALGLAGKLHGWKPTARNGLSFANGGHTLTGTPAAGSLLLAYPFAVMPEIYSNR